MVTRQDKKETWPTRMEMILRSVSEGVCVVDRGLRISLANPSAAKMLDWDESELLGKSAEMIFGSAPDDPQTGNEKILSRIQFALLEGETSHVSAGTFARSNGTTFLAEYICVPLRQDEEIFEAVISFREVTERRDLENAVEAARRAALETAHEKAVFLANLSHEIRTPLNGIVGLTDLLGATRLSTEQTKYLESLKISSGLLLNLVNDILDFSRIEAQKLELETITFDLSLLIEETVRVFAAAARQKNIQLKSKIEKGVDSVLRGDAGRLRQILNNLISNAVKFTPAGEIHLNVKKQKDFLRFEVSDTGIGIEKEKQHRIFEPVVQSDASTTRNFGGTGLGLTISRQLVTMMGGELKVESEIGRGSTFWFTAKFDEPQGIEENFIPPLDAVLRGDHDQHAPRILVVEDNLINQQVALGRLRQLGIVAEIAENGLEAIKAVQEKKYDLILMDCRMPEMDGFEATRALRRLHGHAENLKIIALTASVTVDEREKCLEAGMDDYLPKPATLETLIETLNKHLEVKIPTAGIDVEKNIDHHPFAQIIDPKPLANFLEIESRGEKDFINELLEVYFRHTEVQLVELQNAFFVRNSEKIKNKAHSLKGSSGNIGITRLFQAFGQLESEVINEDWKGVKKTLFEILQDFAVIKNKVSNLTGFGDQKEI